MKTKEIEGRDVYSFHFFCLSPIGLTVILNFNISKVVYYL